MGNARTYDFMESFKGPLESSGAEEQKFIQMV